MRAEVGREARRNPHEGPLVGLLAVAARRAAPALAQHHALNEPEDVEAIGCYLTERFGAAIDTFTPTAYRAWRRHSSTAAASAAANALPATGGETA